MQTSQRTGKTGFAIKIAFGILSFVVAFILIFAASVLFRQFENEILRFPASIALSFSAIAYSFVVTVFLDKNGKIKARFQAGPVNLRWFVFVGVAVAPGLLIAIIYLPFTAINWSDVTNTDFSNGSNIAFLVYAASFLLLWPASVFSYFGIKNLLPSQRLHKIKFPAFSVLNVLFLSGLIFLAATLLESGDLPGRVIDGYNHDDGPWVTWHADPTTSATVSWLTRARSGTRILIGTSPGSITQEMTGTGNVFMHHVILTSLEPGTTYYYTVPDVTFEEDHYSTTFSFTTAPSIARPFSFVVFGDKQPSSSATMLKYNGVVVDGIINASVDFAMQVGDVASSGGDIGDWHLTLLSLARLSANTPTMIAIGNHDYSGGGNLNFQDMFPYPYVNKLLAKHYSFEYLNAHFTVVDTNNLAQEQVAWVEADLASANASASVDWTFVFFHHTIISSGTCNTEWELQKTLAPIFDKYAVTAVFYGHDHHYEHSNYTYGTDGLVHVDPRRAMPR